MIASILLTIVSLIHATTLCLLLLLTVRLVRNLTFLRWVRQSNGIPQPYPRVSILVPARNEDRTIRACLKSLAEQDYPDFEILVLDDQSSDNTPIQLQRVIKEYPMIRILHGSHSPPDGWNGKSYACHRLAERASGEWLLFTDADTLHTSQSVRHGIQQAKKLNVDLLSAMPRQITRTWSERLLVSFIMDFLPLLGIDLRDLSQRRSANAIANGQYILVRASTYHETGGHAAVSNALVDDFALASHFVQQKRRIAIVNGIAMLSCRMYENSVELWQGFSKNIVLSLQTAKQWPWWVAILFAWGFVALFVWPYALLLLDSSRWLAIIEICWLSLLRLMTMYEYQRPAGEVLYIPVSALGVMLLGLNALVARFRRQHILWKDRPYPLG